MSTKLLITDNENVFYVPEVFECETVPEPRESLTVECGTEVWGGQSRSGKSGGEGSVFH